MVLCHPQHHCADNRLCGVQLFKVRAMKEGTAEMSEMAGIIRGNSFVKGKLRRFLRNWTVKSFRLSQTTSSKEIYFRKSSPEE